MLIDLHAHSSGISKCCQIPGNEVVNEAKKVGLDGIVLTNHYKKNYVENNKWDDFAIKYVDEFNATKRYGEQIGIKVFFGIEVTMEKHSFVHLLIYGVDEDFVLKNPCIFDLTQEELYKLVKKHNGILIQAHPFRGNKNNLLDLNYLDGIEINCHPLYEGTHINELISIAKKNNFIVTCGGDYHADTHRPKCGVYFKEVNSIEDIANELKKTKKIELCVQEKDQKSTFNFTYYRKNKIIGLPLKN